MDSLIRQAMKTYADLKYKEITGNLTNIAHAIDAIAETNLRRYIDCQVTMIHRRMQGKTTGDLEIEASSYKRAMES